MDIAITVPLITAALAYFSGGLDSLSSVTGGVMGYMVLFTGGWEWLSLLLVFFALSSIATQYKYTTKSQYRLSQKKRTVENVLGNGLVPLVFALQGNLIGYAASLAVATADTLSSEIGVLSKKPPVSVLDFKTSVKKGANGGVSPLGNTMMVLGSSTIAITSLLLFNDVILFWTVLWAGIFGCFMDSVLGATLENNGIIGNHLVNLLATLSGGILAIIIVEVI